MVQRLLTLTANDLHVAGVADFGSSSEGRLDPWSDIDVAIFIRDDDFDGFAHDWVAWVHQLGSLVLASIGGVGHLLTVVDADPLPPWIDFNCYRASETASLLT